MELHAKRILNRGLSEIQLQFVLSRKIFNYSSVGVDVNDMHVPNDKWRCDEVSCINEFSPDFAQSLFSERNGSEW